MNIYICVPFQRIGSGSHFLLKTCNKQSVVLIKNRINTCIDTKSTCQNELKRGESLKRNSDVTKLQAIAPHLHFTDIGTPPSHQRALKTNPMVPPLTINMSLRT